MDHTNEQQKMLETKRQEIAEQVPHCVCVISEARVWFFFFFKSCPSNHFDNISNPSSGDLVKAVSASTFEAASRDHRLNPEQLFLFFKFNLIF